MDSINKRPPESFVGSIVEFVDDFFPYDTNPISSLFGPDLYRITKFGKVLITGYIKKDSRRKGSESNFGYINTDYKRAFTFLHLGTQKLYYVFVPGGTENPATLIKTVYANEQQ